MKEIEVKFRVHDFSQIRAALRRIGASLIWKGMEENIFFDTKNRNLYKNGTLFRLRQWNDHSVVLTVKTTPKHTNKNYKIKNEYEVEINDFNSARRMIRALGFMEDFRYKKYREHWKIKNAFVELDTIGRMRFIEIEAPQKEINQLARSFGLSWKQAERRGYIKILKDLQKKK